MQEEVARLMLLGHPNGVSDSLAAFKIESKETLWLSLMQE